MYDRIRRHRGALTIALAIFFGVTGWALASIPGEDGTISACYATRGGEVRIIDSTASCRARETAIRWNQQGAQGPPGRDGATGAPGAGIAVLDGAVTEADAFSYVSDEPVELGGPQMTVDVPAGGALVQFMATAELSGTCQVFADVLDDSQSSIVGFAVRPPADGVGYQAWYSSTDTESFGHGAWIVVHLDGGRHSFTMRYQVEGGLGPCSGTIRNRHIYAVVLG